jgi:CDK inhibitor PHO81
VTSSYQLVGRILTHIACIDAVLFASYCGLSRSTPEGQLQPPRRIELDRRCTSIEGAVKFAKANNVLGLLLDATIMVDFSPLPLASERIIDHSGLQTQVPSLIHSVKESGLLLGLFGSAAKPLPHIDAWTTKDGVLNAKISDSDYV